MSVDEDAPDMVLEEQIVADAANAADIESATSFDSDEDNSNDAGESDDHKTMSPIVLENDQSPALRKTKPRSRSLDALSSNANEQSYMFSFRMPHDAINNNTYTQGASNSLAAAGNNVTTADDYKFVLDNYVEYSDDTKIPRLRGKNVGNKLVAAIHSSHWAALVLVVSVSCFLTYSISNHAPFLRADLSQAIVVTLFLATFPEVAASAGAGAFAGMAGLNAIPHYGWLALLTLVVSFVWTVFHRFKILVGCGGRLGTCAFISMNLTVALFGMPSGAVSWSLYGDASWSALELVPSILTVLACTFLSAVGGAVRLTSKIPLNPVQAPTTIALLCMLIIEPTGYKYTGEIDAGLAVGSFVAMASEQYLPSVLDFGAAGLLAGLWILLLDPFFLQFGGKKGFTSFCGFATYVAVSKLISCRKPVTKE